MFSGSLLTPSHRKADQLSATGDSRPGSILYQELNAGKILFGERCSPDSLESLGSNSLHSSYTKEQAAPLITTDLVNRVTISRGMGKNKKLIKTSNIKEAEI